MAYRPVHQQFSEQIRSAQPVRAVAERRRDGAKREFRTKGVTSMRVRFVPTLAACVFTVAGLAGQRPPGGERVGTVFAPRLLDPVSGRLLSNVLIVIRGERIESVTEGAPGPPKADDSRLKGAASSFSIGIPASLTVLPGLIDSHTHLLLEPEDAVTPPVLHKSQAFRAIESTAAARKDLEAGFTTMRDMDSEGADFADVALRDAINRGIVPGPRLYVSGMPLTITGGYMNLLGLSPDIALPDPGVTTDSVAAMVATIRRDVKYGVDLIKIYVTGSLPQVTPELEPLPQMSLDEVKTIVAEAARWHKDVAAHAYGGVGARNAIEGGVRSIEHGILLDQQTIQLMVTHGVYWCPTLYVYTAEPGLDRNGEAFMARVRARHKEAFQAAVKAGVKIAFGTDVGGFDHGTNAREFQVMVDYGMTPLEAIRSATVRGAELLRKEKDLGAIAAGRLADIIGVEGDPLRDISAMTRVRFVMKGGTVVKEQPGSARDRASSAGRDVDKP
jgi:imidazolonepropionase-like amidohydrolase